METSAGILTLRRQITSIALCSASVVLLSGNRSNAADPSSATIAARAFVTTDPEVLAPFGLDRVLASVSAGQSAAWLETLTEAQTDRARRRPVLTPLAGFVATLDDGYWRPAGAEEWSHARPIAIVNRFDLAPADYSHCGEYRLIFSRRMGGRARLNIAIEVAVPNPFPDQGKAGCANIAAFWWELAGTARAADRRNRLENIFFRGVPPVGPILNQAMFERAARIRTSEISGGRPKFAQFELKSRCDHSQPCVRRLTRVPLDNMPDAALFGSTVDGDRAAAFRDAFVRQVASLALPDVNRYSMNIDRTYSVRDVEELVPAFNYRLPFLRSQRTPLGRDFRGRIADELARVGSPLTPEDVIERAETQNCAGCHGKSGPVGGGLVFPKALEQGEHITDESLGESAHLSQALREVFLPYRIDLLQQYLQTTAQLRKSLSEQP